MKTTTTKIQHPGARTAATWSSLTLVLCLLLLCFAQPSHAAITPTGNVDPANPSTWTLATYGFIGKTGIGMLDINAGSNVNSYRGYIGHDSGSTGAVTVDGDGSSWMNGDLLNVGIFGNGTLHITSGGTVSNGYGYIGRYSGSTSTVTVDGDGSSWTNNDDLYVCRDGIGTLDITSGGLVSVSGILTIDLDLDGDGFINMGTGGMLALKGEADDSLDDFLGMINGTDAIRYWDDSIPGWADITGATEDVDYTLDYLSDGDLAGYTMLTVTTPVPEPSTFVGLLALCLSGLLARRRCQQ